MCTPNSCRIKRMMHNHICKQNRTMMFYIMFWVVRSNRNSHHEPVSSNHSQWTPWASYQIPKSHGSCMHRECRGHFPATGFIRNNNLVILTCISARASRTAVMHVRIVNPQRRGKRSRHSRRMRNPKFCVSGKRPMGLTDATPVSTESDREWDQKACWSRRSLW